MTHVGSGAVWSSGEALAEGLPPPAAQPMPPGLEAPDGRAVPCAN